YPRIRRAPRSALFPYTTLFRSGCRDRRCDARSREQARPPRYRRPLPRLPPAGWDAPHPTSVQEPTEVVCPRAGSRETVPCGETVVVTSPKTDAEAMRDALRRRGRPVPPRSTMHRLAALSLSNRAFIALVCIAVAILGVMSMSTLRQELIPSVTLPQIQVVTTSPGSSTEQVKDRISTPVEN